MDKKIRVLVIDDEAIIRMSCKRALPSDEYDVDIVDSGEAGIALFDNHPYDIVLVDLKMPGMDGLQVLETIKKKNSRQKVIIMTGYNTAELIVESLSSGASHFIEKPFAPDLLHDRIREVLQSS